MPVIRALVSCHYGALRGGEPHLGPDSDTNETAGYPEEAGKWPSFAADFAVGLIFYNSALASNSDPFSKQ